MWLWDYCVASELKLKYITLSDLLALYLDSLYPSARKEMAAWKFCALLCFIRSNPSSCTYVNLCNVLLSLLYFLYNYLITFMTPLSVFFLQLCFQFKLLQINRRIVKNGVFLNVTPCGSWFLQEPHGATSQKTPFFIVTAVKTSNPTEG
jgi:hypothetical protein